VKIVRVGASKPATLRKAKRVHWAWSGFFQKILAVLEELGMLWIPGYKPKRNYQNAIFDGIDRYLTKHPEILETVSASPSLVIHLSAEIFVAPPVLSIRDRPIPEPLRRLVRKFDPVKRDRQNRSLGKAGEEFVVDVDAARLPEQAAPASQGRSGGLPLRTRKRRL
jgi:hypothetical protein